MSSIQPDDLRVHILASKYLPEEDRLALVSVLDRAVERYGDHSGFNAVVVFVTYEQFLETCNFLIFQDGLTGRDLGVSIADNLREKDRLFVFTDVAIMGSVDPGNADAIANRIRDQMNEDTKSRASFRKPAQYIAVTENGFAISLAIDERFWTNSW